MDTNEHEKISTELWSKGEKSPNLQSSVELNRVNKLTQMNTKKSLRSYGVKEKKVLISNPP